MPEALPTLYATRADVESIFSTAGVLWRLDDDESLANEADEDTLLEDILREATDIVNQYAMNYYQVAELAESRVVTRWTAYIAAHLLSRRRGNPAQFNDEYDMIIEQLGMVASGQRFIPRLKPAADFLPEVDNYRWTWASGTRSGLGCQKLTKDEDNQWNLEQPFDPLG